jgi:hypothetical protein
MNKRLPVAAGLVTLASGHHNLALAKSTAKSANCDDLKGFGRACAPMLFSDSGMNRLGVPA